MFKDFSQRSSQSNNRVAKELRVSLAIAVEAQSREGLISKRFGCVAFI